MLTSPFFRSYLTRLLYRAHLYLGIFLSIQVLVLFASGAILLFKDEIESASIPIETPSTSCCANEAAFDKALEGARISQPLDRPLSIAFDESDPSTLVVRLGENGSREFRGAKKLFFDAETGLAKDPKDENAKNRRFFDWMLELHRDFLMGSTGKLYVGVLGLLYAFTLISGFLIYGGFMKKLSYSEVRASTARFRFADLHKYIGISVFVWSLLIGLTGAFLAFNGTLLRLYQYTELRDLKSSLADTGPSEKWPSLQQVIASAQEAQPESHVDFIAFPDTQFSTPGHFMVLTKGQTQFTEHLSSLVVVDAATGRQASVRELPFYLKILMLSEPLHFGDYGGPILKIAWLILTILTSALPVSGLLILYHRKKRSQKQSHKSISASRPKPSSGARRPYFVPTLLALTITTTLFATLFVDGSFDHFISFVCLVMASGIGVLGIKRVRSSGAK